MRPRNARELSCALPPNWKYVRKEVEEPHEVRNMIARYVVVSETHHVVLEGTLDWILNRIEFYTNKYKLGEKNEKKD